MKEPIKKRLSAFLLCVLACAASMACTLTPMAGRSPTFSSLDAIVVLGNRPPLDAEGRLRAESRSRLDRGLLLFRSGLSDKMLFTGGDAGGGRSEAGILSAFALKEGVQASAILEENESLTTIENAAFSYRMLCDKQNRSCAPRIALVTTPYHAWRAERLFECAGFLVESFPARVPEQQEGSQTSYGRSFSLYEQIAGSFPSMSDQCLKVKRLVATRKKTENK